MSFVNLMGHDRWTDADIRNRTEAELAGQFPFVEILKRKVTGMMLGQYQLTPGEQAEFQAYAQASFLAGMRADQARADMALLERVLTLEGALARLAQPRVFSAPSDASGGQGEQDPTDAAERAAAQALLDTSTLAELDLLTLRNPAPPETPAEEPET